MRKTIKKYFIPQEGNNHKPYFLRPKALGIMAIFVFIVEILFFASVFFFSNRADYLASVLPSVLVSLTNENRNHNNLSLLSTNPVLQLAAQMKADDMAAKGYFSHTSPDGLEPWHWLKQVGYAYSYAGENLAVDFVDSSDVTDAWMKSPSHRANMINQNYKEVGIAVASGIYKGRKTLFVVQFFGAPKSYSTIAQAPASAVTPSSPSSPVQVAKASAVSNGASSQSSSQSKTVSPQVSAPSIQDVTTDIRNVVLGTDTGVKVADAKPIVSSKANSFLRPIEKIITSPRKFSDYVFGALILLLSIVLALTIFIAIKIQHPSTIAGAIAMIVLVAGMMYINNSVIKSDGVKVPSGTAAAVIQAL